MKSIRDISNKTALIISIIFLTISLFVPPQKSSALHDMFPRLVESQVYRLALPAFFILAIGYSLIKITKKNK